VFPLAKFSALMAATATVTTELALSPWAK